MFESDDFDQVLSQFDFPDISIKSVQSSESEKPLDLAVPVQTSSGFANNALLPSPSAKLVNKDKDKQPKILKEATPSKPSSECNKDVFTSPKHAKRKIISSHFNQNIKRKFPGPAGLLNGTLSETNDKNICHMEILSQDIDSSQNNLPVDIFESPLWLRLMEDLKIWQLNVDDVISIKQQALTGNLRQRKAQVVTAFVESVDRSATDPLIILRDATGQIKCTLHRDAWSVFSMYLVSEYCALVLWKPTVLTTGGAFKKHYLNITLSNIYAIYSSTVVKEEDRVLPEGYVMSDTDYTVIKVENTPQDCSLNLHSSNRVAGAPDINLLDDLDNIFADELF